MLTFRIWHFHSVICSSTTIIIQIYIQIMVIKFTKVIRISFSCFCALEMLWTRVLTLNGQFGCGTFARWRNKILNLYLPRAFSQVQFWCNHLILEYLNGNRRASLAISLSYNVNNIFIMFTHLFSRAYYKIVR